jgi:two-component system OmpR family response regulator
MGAMRILIVEDEPRIAGAVRRALELHGYAVDTAGDADSGLAAAIDPDYDAVILDRMLPGSMDGLDVLTQVRSAGVGTPILMLTALGEIGDKVQGLQTGADDYLVKPFAMSELLARVQVLLRRPTATLGSVLRLADLEIDTANFEVKRAGVPIKLSTREFKLLMYMAYNQGQTLSKDKIISHVWDGDALVVRNTVEVYMGYLRRKIDTSFPKAVPLVQTVRGFGYKLGTIK